MKIDIEVEGEAEADESLVYRSSVIACVSSICALETKYILVHIGS